jgi:hypothetical protein
LLLEQQTAYRDQREAEVAQLVEESVQGRTDQAARPESMVSPPSLSTPSPSNQADQRSSKTTPMRIP